MSTNSTNPNAPSSFEDKVLAIIADFEAVGWHKVNEHLEQAYFEHLGQSHKLSAKAIKGIWQNWLIRRRLNLGFFDPMP